MPPVQQLHIAAMPLRHARRSIDQVRLLHQLHVGQIGTAVAVGVDTAGRITRDQRRQAAAFLLAAAVGARQAAVEPPVRTPAHFRADDFIEAERPALGAERGSGDRARIL